MRSLSSVGLGLSVVFGCLVLALIAEIYYLLWWKRRWRSDSRVLIEHDHSNPAKEAFHNWCWTRQSCSPSVRSTAPQQQQHQLFKSSCITGSGGSTAMEMEMEMVMAAGPPRFLFTINEETKEDMVESEDGTSKLGDDHQGGRTLTNHHHHHQILMKNADSPPYLTPLSSPQFFTPPLTPMKMGPPHCSPGRGYNPFLESSTDAEFNRIKASPPPF